MQEQKNRANFCEYDTIKQKDERRALNDKIQKRQKTKSLNAQKCNHIMTINGQQFRMIQQQ